MSLSRDYALNHYITEDYIKTLKRCACNVHVLRKNFQVSNFSRDYHLKVFCSVLFSCGHSADGFIQRVCVCVAFDLLLWHVLFIAGVVKSRGIGR